MKTFTGDLKNEFDNFGSNTPKIVIRTFQFLCSIMGLNFLIFIVGTFIFDGDAINGMEQGGKYYLNMKGNLTEVSELVFLYSKYHSLSVLWSFTIILGSPAVYIMSKVALKRLLTSGS